MSGATLFSDDFAGDALTSEWVPHQGATVRNGVLDFAPAIHEFCLVTTRRADFGDFCMEADVRIVGGAVGFVLRHKSPREYYLVQFDIGGGPGANPDKVWFHAMSPSADHGMYRELVPSARTPVKGEWYRMRIVAESYTLRVFLGTPGEDLDVCAEWTDPHNLYAKGAIGFWQHGNEGGGEHGQYRSLRVSQCGPVVPKPS